MKSQGYPHLKQMIEERDVKREVAVLINKSEKELDLILDGNSESDLNIVEFNLICVYLGITPNDAFPDL